MSAFWIIVPVKDTRQSKQRLSDRLRPEQRRALAHIMLEEVLEAIAPLRARARCLLVSVDEFAISLARRHAMRVTDVGAHDGHTGAVDAGRRLVAAEGAGGMLTMPGDIPLVTTAEIAALLDAHDGAHGFTIAPAADKMGSNAVACSPPTAVPLRFGENSYFPHLEAARRAGLEPVVRELPGIANDVDTPADIARLLAVDTECRSRTTRYLRDLGFAPGHADEPAIQRTA